MQTAEAAAASRSGSRIFRCIEDLQGDRPWGSLLDAGTGTNSIGWISSLETESWTAVTGAEGHARQVLGAVDGKKRANDRVILGNWADPRFLSGARFDTVLADYLVGAIEGFAPYFQPYLFERLRKLTAKRLYVVGLKPYTTAEPDTPAGKIVWEIGRYRDACLLLTGEHPYREYPAQWVVDHLEASGFRVTAARRFAIRYKQRFVNSQIDMCGPRLDTLPDRGLAAALRSRGEDLRARALALVEAEGGLKHGFDYVLAAVPQTSAR